MYIAITFLIARYSHLISARTEIPKQKTAILDLSFLGVFFGGFFLVFVWLVGWFRLVWFVISF